MRGPRWRSGLVLAVALASAAGAGAEESGCRLGDALFFSGGLPQAASGRGPALAGAGRGGLRVATSRREDSRLFFRTVFMESEGADSGWAGDASQCLAGSTTSAFRDLVALRINFYRAMAGVPADLVVDDFNSAKAQLAALMMSANRNLSHAPPSTWNCYTADGAEAAGLANLFLGSAGPEAIRGYMEDFGVGNSPVGHRRWLLYPQTRTTATGDLPAHGTNLAANATWVLDAHAWDPRPATRESFVSWPPPGYVPYAIVHPRWSFSYPNADFSAATVTMQSNKVALGVVLEPVQDGAGDNTLVWYPQSLQPLAAYSWPKPGADTTYSVTVDNVLIEATPVRFSYDVVVFDPEVAGADTVTLTLTGSQQPAANQANAYSFPAVAAASGYQWRYGSLQTVSGSDDAENGPGNFTPATTAGYSVISGLALPWRGNAFHLAHLNPATDQTLTYQGILVPGASAKIQWRGWLGYATPYQVAKLQVSLDDGRNWVDLYSLAGAGGTSLTEAGFASREISLAPYANRTLRLRFCYHYAVGSYYGQADYGVGWYIDDISFTDVERLVQTTTGQIGADPNWGFVPPQVATYGIQVRPLIGGGLGADWGPLKRVTSVVAAVPQLSFSSEPIIQGNQATLNFKVTNYRAGLTMKLLKATQPDGPWIVDTAASLQTVAANADFKFITTASGSAATYFRLRAE